MTRESWQRIGIGVVLALALGAVLYFGVANQHLHTAATELEAVREGGPQMDLQALQAQQREVEGMNLNVATDLEVQRAQVLDFLARLDELLPDERTVPATSVRPEAAAATETTSGGT